jgi:DNA-binding response OmpR family regulator
MQGTSIIGDMGEPTILLIEKASSKAPTFESALERKGYSLAVAPTGSQGLTLAKKVSPVMVILNAASLGSSGVRICKRLHNEIGQPQIHIFDEDKDPPVTHNCDVMLQLPFTPRKLVNRIKRLMPTNRQNTIEVGPIELAPNVRVARMGDRETRLTPKAASLLEVFLKHPDETLDRGFLMREVWDTNYIGDTRTLDVHVRWVRLAIEADPSSPRHIKTVRGVGYRFEPHPAKSASNSARVKA